MENPKTHLTSLLKNINASWTLFLDRDGVINKEVNKNYVKSRDEFIFLPHAIEAIALLNRYFGRVVIVTNQRGVALGLMGSQDLEDIHDHMKQEVEKQQGHIDLILACTDFHLDSFLRKPQAGMAYAAKKALPVIDFQKSVMVGNSHSDLLFGRNVGMRTVFLSTNHTLEPHQEEHADWKAESLWEVAKVIQQIVELK